MGVAPIRALVDGFARQRRRGDTPLVVIYRARRERDLVFRAELDRIAATGQARVVYVLGRRGDRGPARALSARGLAELVPDVAQRDVYVCGPPGLVQAVRSAVRRLGVPRGRLHLDPFEF
jgi:ferredoxin-NADP reductase